VSWVPQVVAHRQEVRSGAGAIAAPHQEIHRPSRFRRIRDFRLALTIETRDAYTEGDCRRRSEYAVALGRQLALSQADLDALRSGGILHDIGKVGIPDVVLLKRRPLTPDEFEIMKQLTAIGERLCGTVGSLKGVRPIVPHHHERLEGTRYPDGLRGEAIPLLAQIVGIVHVFDALTTDRPYRLAATHEEACSERQGEAARGWRTRGWRSADLVDRFTALLRARRIPITGGTTPDDAVQKTRVLSSRARRRISPSSHSESQNAPAAALDRMPELTKTIPQIREECLCGQKCVRHRSCWS
jgi:response regulator RpfG family c-di-GMP phosphodiesterase